jgi:hypothetical protein
LKESDDIASRMNEVVDLGDIVAKGNIIRRFGDGQDTMAGSQNF